MQVLMKLFRQWRYLLSSRGWHAAHLCHLDIRAVLARVAIGFAHRKPSMATILFVLLFSLALLSRIASYSTDDNFTASKLLVPSKRTQSIDARELGALNVMPKLQSHLDYSIGEQFLHNICTNTSPNDLVSRWSSVYCTHFLSGP